MRTETVVAKTLVEAQRDCPWARYYIEAMNRGEGDNVYLCFATRKEFIEYLDGRVRLRNYVKKGTKGD